MIESAFSIVETVCRNVKRWRTGDQIERIRLGRPDAQVRIVSDFEGAATRSLGEAIKLALTGFWIAMALRTYTFYLNTHHIEAKQSIILFLPLCLFSLGSEAFDNFSLLGAITGWFGVALGNAYLYVVVGRALRARIQNRWD